MKFILLFLLYISMASTALANTKHDIEIIKFKFSSAEITIAVGDTIRWTNKEKRQYHSVWFEKLGEPEPQYFFPDEFFERTFDKAGDFPYRCGPHPRMIGIVHVKPADTKQAEKVATKANTIISKERQKEILHLLKHDCGSCHGMTLKGGLGPSLKPDAINKMSTEQIVATITYGRPGTPMPPWKPFFNQQEIVWLTQQLQQGIK